MPPAPPDSSVGRASGPVGAARRIRRIRKSRFSSRDGHPERRPEGQDEPVGSVSTTPSTPSSTPSIPSTSSKRSSALEALLVDLGSQIHRGLSISQQTETTETLSLCPTGLSALDAYLGGGFPYGRLCEICGAPSSGRTSLALTLLAETLERGVLAAWIDLADAFDPASAVAAGGDLERLLWVRARSEDEALRSCERLLQTEGFELIILDSILRETPSRSAAIRDVSWLRLARLAASTHTVLVVLSNTSATGSRAELVLEMRPLRAHFVGPPSLLDGLETTAVLRRHRSRPTGQEILLSLGAMDAMDAEPIHPKPPSNEPSNSREAR